MSLFRSIGHLFHDVVHTVVTNPLKLPAVLARDVIAGARQELGMGLSAVGLAGLSASHRAALAAPINVSPTYNVIYGPPGPQYGGFSPWQMDSSPTWEAGFPGSGQMYQASLTPFQEAMFFPDWGE
jgi:hypothetical protein